MTMRTQEKAVNVIYKNDEMIGFFTRDEKANENLVFLTKKASIEEMARLFTNEAKIPAKKSEEESGVEKVLDVAKK